MGNPITVLIPLRIKSLILQNKNNKINKLNYNNQ